VVFNHFVLIFLFGVDFWLTEDRFDSEVTQLINEIFHLLIGEIGSFQTIWSQVS